VKTQIMIVEFLAFSGRYKHESRGCSGAPREVAFATATDTFHARPRTSTPAPCYHVESIWSAARRTHAVSVGIHLERCQGSGEGSSRPLAENTFPRDKDCHRPVTAAPPCLQQPSGPQQLHQRVILHHVAQPTPVRQEASRLLSLRRWFHRSPWRINVSMKASTPVPSLSSSRCQSAPVASALDTGASA